MEEQSDISMWRQLMAQAEDQRNMGIIMLKPRRVGISYLNELARINPKEYYDMMMGTFENSEAVIYIVIPKSPSHLFGSNGECTILQVLRS